jgi:hypothetical protein
VQNELAAFNSSSIFECWDNDKVRDEKAINYTKQTYVQDFLRVQFYVYFLHVFRNSRRGWIIGSDFSNRYRCRKTCDNEKQEITLSQKSPNRNRWTHCLVCNWNSAESMNRCWLKNVTRGFQFSMSFIRWRKIACHVFLFDFIVIFRSITSNFVSRIL